MIFISRFSNFKAKFFNVLIIFSVQWYSRDPGAMLATISWSCRPSTFYVNIPSISSK